MKNYPFMKATVAVFAVMLIPASFTSLFAQVVAYEDCAFRGKAVSVPTGDYRSMAAVGFNNDSISSVRVPQGFEVTIYQHEDFAGFSSRIDEDIACLDKSWNDQASSMRVSAGTGANNSAFLSDGVTTANMSRIEFAGVVLQRQATSEQWLLTNAQNQKTRFRQLSANENAIYLQADRADNRLRIDLFSKDVTVLSASGEKVHYDITRALRRNNAQFNQAPISDNLVPVAEIGANPFGVVRGNCFSYRAYTLGGEGGVRFSGENIFHRFDKKPFSGSFCGKGVVDMELNKKSKNTVVVVEIQGQKYSFAAMQPHDVYKNTWYRKSHRLKFVKN